MPYGPHTEGDRERMLAALGLDSVDALFADIPAELRASGLDLPDPEPEPNPELLTAFAPTSASPTLAAAAW